MIGNFPRERGHTLTIMQVVMEGLEVIHFTLMERRVGKAALTALGPISRLLAPPSLMQCWFSPTNTS